MDGDPVETELPVSEEIRAVQAKYQQLVDEISSVVLGQSQVVEQLLLAIMARGHALLIGVPGLAKTLLVHTLADALHWDFKRIQFTPDLMPTDITGAEILETDVATGERSFRFVKGPIFANLVLADEINRTPPKTQAALLEAMQEYSVTVGGHTLHLEPPFTVVATQNPIEHEGTYPLPEAQLDRFMMCIHVDYPKIDTEIEIVERTTAEGLPTVTPQFTREELIGLQNLVRQVPVSRHVMQYAVLLARATRPGQSGGLEFVNNYVEWGAGPRASQYLILTAKARALLRGRPAPSTADVKAVAQPVLRHRVLPNYHATGEGITAERIVNRILELVKEPDYAE